MTTIINANNTGITQTVDTSGILQIQTANTAAITIDTSQNITCNSTGAITVSSGTTAQRPSSPANGMLRYNTTLACFEVYANNTWALSNVTPPPTNTVAPVVAGSTAVGGTANVTNGTWNGSPTGYYYQWYANSVAISSNATSNTFVITSTQNGANLYCNVTAYNIAGNSSPAKSNVVGPVTSSYTISYLVIAGGGGGGTGVFAAGFGGGGGGGAGGYLANTATINPGIVYTATVGGGGAGGAPGATGTNSTLVGTGLSVTASGGGYGGRAQQGTTSGGSGGSGGGGGVGGGGGTGTAGQGNNGGGPGGPNAGAGGGAGAAGAGGGGSNAGGSGSASSITGSSVTRAGGGGGGSYDGNAGGAGGAGGGGAGGRSQGGTTSGTSGSANTGGGGGGGTQIQGSDPAQFGGAGSGGSGVIILSIPTASYSGTQSGATVTTSGSNTILTFNSSGTYTG